MGRIISNLIITGLLVLILLNLYLMPRFNYGKILSEFNHLQSRQSLLESKMEAVRPLLADGSKRRALAKTLDSVAVLVDTFQNDAYNLFEEIGGLQEAVQEHSGEIERLKEIYLDGELGSSPAAEMDGATVEADELAGCERDEV